MLNKQEILTCIEPHVMPCPAEDSKLAHILGAQTLSPARRIPHRIFHIQTILCEI